jgi:hypothetical protein
VLVFRGRRAPQSGSAGAPSSTRHAPAAFLESANGYRFVGRQGSKAGGPHQPLAIALPTKAEAVIGLCDNPRDAAKFPAGPAIEQLLILADQLSPAPNIAGAESRCHLSLKFGLAVQESSCLVPATAGADSRCRSARTVQRRNG